MGELGWTGSKGGVYVSAGRRFLGQAAGLVRVDGWQAGAGGWMSVSKNAEIGAFYDWRDSSNGITEDPQSAGGYLSVRLNPAWRMEVSGFAGLSQGAADFGAGLRATWRSGTRR